MRRKNDILWKGMIEEVFDDLLRFVFPEAERVFNLQRGFDFMDKEFGELFPQPLDPSDTRHVDKLVKVFQRNGKEEYILVHVEVQHQMDKNFSERMFEYYYRIRDWHKCRISALAIFAGGTAMPGRFSEECHGTSLIYKYNTLDIRDYPDAMLEASENPFAAVMLAAKKALLIGTIEDQALMEQGLEIGKALIKKGMFPKEKVKVILLFLKNVLVFKNRGMSRKFGERLDSITNKQHDMGIIEQLQQISHWEGQQKGIRKGRKQGLVEGREHANHMFVTNLLLNSDFTVEKIAAMANVEVEFVNKVKAGLGID